MTLKTQNIILQLIKFVPITVVFVLSFFITVSIVSQANKSYDTQIDNIQKIYLEDNQKKIKYETDMISRLIDNTKKESEVVLKEKLKRFVKEANKMANNLYLKYKDEKEIDEIIEIIVESLRAIRFNSGRGYFFVYYTDGVNLLLPTAQHLENKNLMNSIPILKESFKKIIQKGEHYENIFWFKPNIKTKKFKKIVYSEFIKSLNIIIGTGEYWVDFEKEVEKKLLKNIDRLKFENKTFSILDERGEYVYPFSKEAKEMKHKRNTQQIIEYANVHNRGYLQNKETISYIKKSDATNWIIVSEFNKDKLTQLMNKKKVDIEKIKEESIKNIFLISLILTLLFSFISMYITSLLRKILLNYEDQVNRFIKESIEKEKVIQEQCKMATMGEMMDYITHQWKQPINVITIASSGIKMEQEFNTLTQEKLTNTLNNILESGKYLSSTIDDFRNFFSENKKKSRFDIKDTFEKVFSLMQFKLDNKEIVVQYTPTNIEITGYENELIQVLMNILKNAKEQLLMKNKKSKKVIFIETHEENSTIHITITDNANGIPLDVLPKLFTKNYTTKEEQKGSGLGLYMSKQIIEENMHGKIRANNREVIVGNQSYQGARFEIVLPKNTSQTYSTESIK